MHALPSLPKLPFLPRITEKTEGGGGTLLLSVLSQQVAPLWSLTAGKLWSWSLIIPRREVVAWQPSPCGHLSVLDTSLLL